MKNLFKPLAISALLILSNCSNEELNDESVITDDEKGFTSITAKVNTTTQAENYDKHSGIQIAGGGSKVGYINNNDWIRFDDFEYSGANSVSVRASSNTNGGTIEFRTGSDTGGDLLGTVSISNTGGWNNMQTFTGSIDDDSNNSDLYIVFKGSSGFLIDIDSFEFSGSSNDGANADGSSTNLALDGTAEQSSTNNSGVPSRAIDGNTNGNWGNGSVTHTTNSFQPWWQVRLDNDTNIEQVVIWNRTNCGCVTRLSNFDVFIYNQSGNQVFKTTITDTPSPSVTINTGGVTGSRVRVKLKGTKPLSLAEVQVFGEGGGNNGGDDSDNDDDDNDNDGNTPGAILGLTNDDWKLNGFTASPTSAKYYDDVMD